MSHDSISPRPNGDTKAFWEGSKKHQLMFQKCINCGHVRWPPSIACPSCHSFEYEWISAMGKGRIKSYVVYYTVVHPAYKDKVPYITAVVELEEGPRLLTNIVDCGLQDIHYDMKVEVYWEDIESGFSLPKFVPA
jgi:uncharacterized OB-fold protein